MADPNNPSPPEAEFLLYQTDDGHTRVEVRFDGETAWLTQASMARLYQTTPQNITQHIAAIYEDGELDDGATCKSYLQVRDEGRRRVRRALKHYSLPMILAVGYRVRSHRGVQFRRWATGRLEEYVIKGFTLDDERLKRAGSGRYFDELLERIRDIRSSEKVFWRKVLEIYATSIDYDSRAKASHLFFSTVQNKMHWAVHGQTAAEVIVARADAAQPNMGMTSWLGDRPRRTDAVVAKNYLRHDELEALNRIVNAYLEFAELQAIDRKPMYMADWIRKLDDFLRLSDRDILTHAGKVSHDDAVESVTLEYERFNARHRELASSVEHHFEEAITGVKQIEQQRQTATRGKSPRTRSKKKQSPP